MFVPPAAAHGVLLERPHPGGRLAGVEHHRARALELVGPAPGVRGDARGARQDVEDGALGHERSCGWSRAGSRGRSPRRSGCRPRRARRPTPRRCRAGRRPPRRRAPRPAARRPHRRPGPRGARRTAARPGSSPAVVTSVPSPRSSSRARWTRRRASSCGEAVLGHGVPSTGCWVDGEPPSGVRVVVRWASQRASSRSGKSERTCPPRVSSRRWADERECLPEVQEVRRLPRLRPGLGLGGRQRREVGERRERPGRRRSPTAPVPTPASWPAARRGGGRRRGPPRHRHPTPARAAAGHRGRCGR